MRGFHYVVEQDSWAIEFNLITVFNCFWQYIAANPEGLPLEKVVPELYLPILRLLQTTVFQLVAKSGSDSSKVITFDRKFRDFD